MSKKAKITLFCTIILVIGIGFFWKGNEGTNILEEFILNGKYVSLVGENLLVSDGKNFGYYDLDGNKKVDLKYTYSQNLILNDLDSRDDLFVVNDEKFAYGVVSSKGEEIIPKMYEAIKIVSSDCFIVRGSDNLWSVINNNNKNILNEKYDKYEIIDGKGAILIKDNKYIIIDIHGNVISKGLYVYVVDYNEGSVLVGQYGTGVNDLFVYTNNEYKVIQNIEDFVFVKEKVVYFIEKGSTEFKTINIENGKIDKNAYVDFSINDMELIINSQDLVGYKATDGTIIKNKYQVNGSEDFTEYGVAVVSLNNLVGVIDKKGNEVLPCKYQDIKVFSEKVFGVTDNSKYYYLVDEKGEKIADNIVFSDNYIAYKKDNKCGVLNNYGKTVFASEYMDCQIYDNLVIVKDNNDKWIIKRQG